MFSMVPISIVDDISQVHLGEDDLLDAAEFRDASPGLYPGESAQDGSIALNALCEASTGDGERTILEKVHRGHGSNDSGNCRGDQENGH
jgi:hypothetical protein